MDFWEFDHVLLEAAYFAHLHDFGLASLLFHEYASFGVVGLLCSGFCGFEVQLVLGLAFQSFELEVGLHAEGEGLTFFFGRAVGHIVLFAQLLDLFIDFHGDLL